MLQRSIDGYQIVDAVDLDAVAGIINDGDVRIPGLVAELPQRPPNLRCSEIGAQCHDIEICLPEGRRQPGGVAGGIGEVTDILVVGIADRERNTLFREGWLAQKPAGPNRENDGPNGTHGKPKSARAEPSTRAGDRNIRKARKSPRYGCADSKTALMFCFEGARFSL